MGLEAKASVVRTIGREVVHAEAATVLWEGDAFIVRGDARVKILREAITGTAVQGAELVLQHAQGSVRVTLGAALATKWRDKITASPKSRLDKMGITAGTRVRLANWGRGPSVAALTTELTEAGAVVRTGKVSADDGVVLLLVEQEDDLARIAALAAGLADVAALWVVHPKGVPAVADARIFAVATLANLTYTKVASFSATQSAEKLVRPVSARATPTRKKRSPSQ